MNLSRWAVVIEQLPPDSNYKPTPWHFPKLAGIAMILPILLALSWAVGWNYQDSHYEHGPLVFLGYEFVCAGPGERNCSEIPYYVEDTSQLDLPWWVENVRSARWMPVVALLVLSIYPAFIVWSWWEPRRRLTWPYQGGDEFVELLKESLDGIFPLEPLGNELSSTRIERREEFKSWGSWQEWDEWGRILYGFGYQQDAARCMEVAKLLNLEGIWGEVRLSETFAPNSNPNLREEATEWHDRNIAYVSGDKIAGRRWSFLSLIRTNWKWRAVVLFTIGFAIGLPWSVPIYSEPGWPDTAVQAILFVPIVLVVMGFAGILLAGLVLVVVAFAASGLFKVLNLIRIQTNFDKFLWSTAYEGMYLALALPAGLIAGGMAY